MRNPILLAASLAALVAPAACVHVGVGGEAAPTLERVHSLGEVVTSKSAGPRTTETLVVHPMRGRKRFDERVLRQEADQRVAILESEHWAETPQDAATDAIREGLARSGAFAGVSTPQSGLASTRALNGYVLSFHVLRTEKGPWRAVFKARLELVDPANGALLSAGVYEAAADLPGESLEGLGPAMTRAVGDAVTVALSQWRATAGALR
jgi:ABC-type uncharacterized transport system auxiliary subunit